MADKPAVLQDSVFTVEESIIYKACRTGAKFNNLREDIFMVDGQQDAFKRHIGILQ